MSNLTVQDGQDEGADQSSSVALEVIEAAETDLMLPVTTEGGVAAMPHEVYLQAIHARTNVVQYSVFALLCALAGSVYYLNGKIESMQNAFAWRTTESKDAILQRIDRNYENPKPVTITGENVRQIADAIKKDQLNARARAYALQAVTCVNGEIGKSNSRVYSITYNSFENGRHYINGKYINGVHMLGSIRRTRGADTNENTMTTIEELGPGYFKKAMDFFGFESKVVNSLVTDDSVLYASFAWNFDMYVNYDVDPLTIAAMNVFVVQKGNKVVQYNASKDVINTCLLTSE